MVEKTPSVITFMNDSIDLSDLRYEVPYYDRSDLTIKGYAGTCAQQLAYEDHIKFNALDGYDHTTSYFQNGFYESYEGSGSVRYSSFDIVHATIPEYIKGTKITRVDLSCCNALKSITFLSSNIDVEGCYLEECLALEEIKGYRGSTAEAYAAEHDLKFTELPLPNEIPSYLDVSDGTVTRCDMNAVDVFIPESYGRNEYYGSDQKTKITEISADAFRGCTKLRSVTIPGSVTSIPEGLFSDCEQLAEIHGVAGGEVEEYAISHGLTFVEVSGAPTYYSVVVHEVRDDQEGSGSDYSGEGTSATSYGDQKRRYEAKLLAVDPDCYDLVIPEKVPYYFTEEADLVMIGDNAFYGMKNVSKVVVPETIREYYEYYDSNSESSIEELILPKGIERIGGASVPNITILDPKTEILGELRAQTITGYYMSTAYDYAKEHDIWFNAILDENDPAPEGFTYELFPEPYTFSGSFEFGHDHFVEPGIRVTGIGSAEEVEIPAMINNVPVREIIGEALEQNSNLKKLTVAAMDCQFPDSYSQSTVQEIVGYLNSSAMTYAESRNLPFFDITAENQPQIPEGTRFYANSDYVRMEIPYDVQLDQTTLTIPESMYGLPVAEVSISCKGTFDEIIAPESVEYLSISGTTVGKLTIYNSQCEISGGDSPVNIGQIHAPLDSAASRFAAENHIDFYDLDGTNYSCPEYLEYYLTDDIDGSRYAVISGHNKEIPEDLVIPESIYGVPVRCIDDYAFEGCSDIKTVTIPESVTDIGIDAFCDCSSLTDLYIEGDLEKAYDYYICDKDVMIHGESSSITWEYAVNNRVPFTGSDGALYYQAQWEWAEDNSSCVAKLVCSKCGDTHSYTAAVTSNVALEPTYDDPGIMEHTAVVKVDGETYTDTVQSEIPALERTSIENARLNIGNTSFEYNGQEQTLTIASVKLNGVKLTEGVDYIVSGNKASESGDYSVVVTGIGAYKGTITRPWSIYKKYTVYCTVNDYTSCYIYTDKAHCTVTAEEVEGKFFSHWRLADDENSFLSSRQSYTFRVVCDTDIEAVYVDSKEEVLDKPAIVITSVNAAQNRITYEVTRSVPDGYTVVSNGILYGTSKLLFADADPETRDQLIRFTDDEGSTELKEKVHMSQSGVNTNQGYYAYTLNIGDHTDLKVYLRGYMILKDWDGQLVTYYTEIFDKTYDQVCQG
ncbi:MAG TPA: leucine-rich repeat protein [Ruminococcus sp.]|nr:leucine-rich repeat protein [Ruminococcus sp.]